MVREHIGFNRVYSRIDLDNIRFNVSAMKALTKPDMKTLAVIKADGYGHGAVEIAKETEDLDYIWGFATATVEEALILRRHHISKPILILGYSFREQFVSIVENNIRPAIFNFEDAKLSLNFSKDITDKIKINGNVCKFKVFPFIASFALSNKFNIGNILSK